MIISFVLGLVFLAIALFSYIKETRFLQKAEQATGRVVDLRRNAGTDSHGSAFITYYPIIHFQNREGREVEYEGGIGSDPPAYKIGQTVEMYYDPDNPKAIQMHKFWSQYGAAFLFGILGLVFMLIGVGVFMQGR